MRFLSLLALIFLVACATPDKPSPGPGPSPGPLPQPTPVPGPEYQEFCVIGDMGTGDDEQKMVASFLEDESCDSVLVTGDIVYSTGIKSADDSKFFSRFYDVYKGMMDEKMFYLSLGNHDYYGKESAWLDVGKKYDRIYFPHYYYLVEKGDVCLVALDTNDEYKDQTRWAEKVYPQAKCKFSIAFGHHPLISSGSHGGAKWSRKSYLEKMVEGKVDMYVAGHEHQLSDEGVQKETRFLISGAGGKLRRTKKDTLWSASKYGYLVVRVSGHSANYLFKVIEDGKLKVAHYGEISGKGLR